MRDMPKSKSAFFCCEDHFNVITSCISLVYAKPQYNYPAPSVPSGSYGTPGVGFGGGASVGGGTISSFSGVQGFGGSSISGSAGFSGGDSSGFSRVQGIGGGISAGGTGGASLSSGGGTLVQKHIYVHVAPPEPEEARPQSAIAPGQSTKHYKIIFIKAPTYPSYQQQILQAQAQNEEKTLVYVLVKKPDETADITLPTAAPTAPSKPEVYFIRYKAKSEVTGAGATGSQFSGTGIGLASGAGIGGGATLGLSSSSSSNTQFNLNTGGSSSSVSVGRPATNYGPPGKSGPY